MSEYVSESNIETHVSLISHIYGIICLGVALINRCKNSNNSHLDLLNFKFYNYNFKKRIIM